MRYRTFGGLAWQVSEIGFGAWAIGGNWGSQRDEDSVKALHKALDLGCNFIDTARAYGDGRSERVIARVLSVRQGDRIYVATKIPPKPNGDWPPGPDDRIEERFPDDYLRDQLERSLRDLKTECIDLVQIHTWSRAWNRNPAVFALLRQFREEGKIHGIGVSTPEHDQDAVNDLVRNGWVDSVQLIYNIFVQESRAELLHLCREKKVAVIVRVPFDESSLTGKLTPESRWEQDDIRSRYFAGDRLARTVERVEKLKSLIRDSEPDLATAALKFSFKPAAVSTVIPGIRNERQAEMNCGVGAEPPMKDELEAQLRRHYWRRDFWYSGK